MTEEVRVAFDSEDSLESFLRDPSVAPMRRRAMRLPALAPGEAVFCELEPGEAILIRDAAARHGATNAEG